MRAGAGFERGWNPLTEKFLRVYLDRVRKQIGFKRPSTSRPRIVLLQQDMPDVENFVDQLATLYNIEFIVRRPYRQESAMFRRLRRRYDVRDLTWNELQGGQFVEMTRQALLRNAQPLVVVEIGGYHAAALQYPYFDRIGRFLGVIEMTPAGVNRHVQVLSRNPALRPVIEVVTGPAKTREASDVVDNVVDHLRGAELPLGRSFGDMTVGVIGAGRMGVPVIERMRREAPLVLVADRHAGRLRLLDRLTPRVQPVPLSRLVTSADFLLEATGETTLTVDVLSRAKPDAGVLNLGTHGIGVNMGELHAAVGPGEPVSPLFRRYGLNGKSLYVGGEGEPINHQLGLPVGAAIGELQGEVFYGIERLADRSVPRGIHNVGAATRELLATFAIRTAIDVKLGMDRYGREV